MVSKTIITTYTSALCLTQVFIAAQSDDDVTCLDERVPIRTPRPPSPLIGLVYHPAAAAAANELCQFQLWVRLNERAAHELEKTEMSEMERGRRMAEEGGMGRDSQTSCRWNEYLQ